MMAEQHIDSQRGINNTGINPKVDNPDNSALNNQIQPHPTNTTVQEPKSTQNDTEIVAKLKKQNAKLREELKQLSEQLSTILEKQKAKRPEKPVINQDLAKEELKKELENAQKQLQIYSKDIKTLKHRIEYTGSSDRVANLENALHEKERAIEKLVDEKRILERLNREQEKQLTELKEEYKKSSNITAYTEEIRHLKLKLREIEEREQKSEKTNQKKHEYFMVIEQKYRELCQQCGIDPVHSAAAKRNASMDPTIKGNSSFRGDGRISPLNRIPNTRSDASLRSQKKPRLNPNDDLVNTTSYTDDKFRELQNAIKILKKAHLTNEKKYKMELDHMKARTQDLELELKDTSQRLREKEKESNIMNSRMNEMKRTIKTSLLPALEDDHDRSKGMIGSMGGTSSAKKKQMLNGSPPLGETRKDERGKPAATDKEFSDQTLLKDVPDNKIASIKVWCTNANITGIQAYYRDDQGKTYEGAANVSATMKGQYKEDSISLSGMDYVKEICGFLDKNEKYVQALIFTSAKGESKRIGNSTPDSKLFKLDINEYEYPTILYGATEYQNDANQPDKETGSLLTKIGVVIRSHAVEEDITQKNEDYSRQNESMNGKRILHKSKPSSTQLANK